MLQAAPAATAEVLADGYSMMRSRNDRAIRCDAVTGGSACNMATRRRHAIAALQPTSLDELAAIKGIGPSKLQLYGAALLAAVAAANE